MSDLGGQWRTVGGRRIFIKDGQDLAAAMRESGKFSNKNIRNLEYKHNPNIKTSENFDDMIDAKVSEEVMKYTNDLYNEYSDILPERTIVWKTMARGKVLANANYNLNPALAKDYDSLVKTIKFNQDDGYLVNTDNPIKQIVAHEVGHNIQMEFYRKVTTDNIKTQKGADKWTKNFMKKVVNKYEKENTNILISDAVSKYGAENYFELFSESFAEYTSSSKPRPFARTFGIMFEEERKKLK